MGVLMKCSRCNSEANLSKCYVACISRSFWEKIRPGFPLYSQIFGVFVVFIVIFYTTICNAEGYARYKNGEVSFDYYSDFKPFPPQVQEGMKQQIEMELTKYNRKLIILEMYIASNEEAAFFFTKTEVTKPVTAQNILVERQEVHKEAMRDGYVTKVNQLNIANVTNNPAVIEDVEWNNGGRGKTIKILSVLYIYEFSLSVINKSNYKKYEPMLDHTIASFSATSK